MSDNWQRLRRPDEVPTPVAVAVSDYCRRAGSPASAALVREALALVAENEDFRIRDLTDTEPEARPLGPFAVVDLVRGTPARIAAQRQEVGYYELVRDVAELRHNPPPAPEAPAAPEPAPTTFASLKLIAGGSAGREALESLAEVPTETLSKKSGPRGAPATASVKERIAPIRRPAGASAEHASVDEGPASAATGRQRNLPAPRGRFSRLPPAKQPYSELRNVSGYELLSAHVAQQPNRFSLFQNLSEQFQGSRRGPLTEEDLLEALEAHGLLETLTQKERETLLSSYTEHRGATSKVSWALGLSPSELSKLIKELQLTREVEEIRERFRRDALSPQNLGHRLDLLGRDRYLADLGIKRRFMESLTGDLRALLRDVDEGDGTVSQAVRKISRKHGVSHELLERAIQKLGLSGELQRRLSSVSTHP